MARNISALTPEIIRAEAASAALHFLIGKWIALDDNKIKGKRFIIDTEIQLHDTVSAITFIAVNKKGFDQLVNARLVDEKNLFSGKLLLFKPEDKKGHLATDDGRTIAFSIADQSETPNTLREEMNLLERFPVGETISFTKDFASQFSPPLSYREAIITGYMVSKNQINQNWAGMVAFMDAVHPTEESFHYLPAGIFLISGFAPAVRSTNDAKPSFRKRLDA